MLNGAVVPVQVIQGATGTEKLKQLKLFVIVRIRTVNAALPAKIPLKDPSAVHKGEINAMR